MKSHVHVIRGQEEIKSTDLIRCSDCDQIMIVDGLIDLHERTKDFLTEEAYWFAWAKKLASALSPVASSSEDKPH